jgi:8-oxo-dGTP pyrophosphatase MutT (NUDIX family)
MEHTHPQIVAVGGVVYRCTSHGQLELLLIKKQGGFWTLPKGRIKRDENPIAAVQREIFEETGLAGTVEDPIREVIYQIVKGGQPCHKRVTYYLFRAQAGTPRPDKREGIARVRWFSLPHALDRIRRERVREVAHHASMLLEHAIVE